MRKLIAGLVLAATTAMANALPYSNLYVFGDSLSDVGNVSTLTGGAIPGTPYYSGRFSNGPVWAETFAAGLGLSVAPSVLGGNDYAYGGARTSYHRLGPPFLGVLDQISSFTGLPGNADAGALYVVWGGSNNLQDALTGLAKGLLTISGAEALARLAADDIASSLQALFTDGARRFLVANSPDIALIPRVSELGALLQGVASDLSSQFNARLALRLEELSVLGYDIKRYDAFAALNELVSDGSAFGLSNVTDRCYTGDDLTFTGGGSVCADPDSYLFWDGIHPTAAVHDILSEQMLALFVPEPGMVGLLTIGIALLAFTRRQRVLAS